MTAPARHMPKKGALFALILLMGLGGCDLHRENALRADLLAWFQLGDTLAFESRRNCTVAVFRAHSNVVRSGLTLAANPADAQAAYRQTGRAAVRMAGASPDQLTEAMMASEDRVMGKKVLVAGALAAPCLTEALRRDFSAALTRKGAVLGYAADLGGVMILDPEERKLFFAAGDPL